MKTNPAVWFDIYVQDIARARKFYESVLEVKLEKLNTPDLQMLAFPGSMEVSQPGIAGALVKMDGFASGGNSTLVYFGCADCAAETGRVASSGGSVFREKMSIGEYGFCSLAIDTEGNMFGLHSMK